VEDSTAAQVERQGDQALLRAVVEITLDPAAGLVGGDDDPGPGGGELGAAVSVGDSDGDELGELLQAALDPARQPSRLSPYSADQPP